MQIDGPGSGKKKWRIEEWMAYKMSLREYVLLFGVNDIKVN